MVRIGDIELQEGLSLAPMAGVTDFAFRGLCARMGAVLTTTEMVSARALVYKDEKTKTLLYRPAEERPCAVQIFGHEPEIMAQAAQMALELSGADILDINMGCPVGKIVKSGDGSALMNSPELAESIIKAVVSAVKVPVTVKFRKGWDKGSVNALNFGRMCQDAGAAAVTIHGRTRAQMYSGRADWDIIRALRESLSIPVIANGDVFTAEDGLHLLRYTGCRLAAVGRGSFGNPWIFSRARALLAGEAPPEPPSLTERMALALGQIEALAGQRGERIACLEARHHVPWYLHGVPHAGIYRRELVQVESLDQLRAIVKNILRDLGP